MPKVELSKSGKVLILVPVYLFVLSFFLQNPFVAMIGISILSLFFFSQYYLKEVYQTIDVSNSVGPGTKNVGDVFTLKQEISSDKPVNAELKVDVEEDFDLKSDSDHVGPIRSEVTLKHKLAPRNRGYQMVGGVKGWIYDPLKLYKMGFEREKNEEIIVHSSKDAIKRAEAYAQRSHMEELVEDISRYTTTSGELEEIREYQPGDRLRDIHWKSMSKFQKYMTKEYEKMTLLKCQVLLDAGPSMRRSVPGRLSKFEHSVFMALELLKKFQLSGHDIGLTVFGHKDILFHHRPDHRRTSFQRFFKQMADLPAPISSDGYVTRRYDGDVSRESLRDAEKKFARKVGDFISGAPTDDLGGLILATRRLKKASLKRSLIILITDLEGEVNSTIKAVEKMNEMDHEVWVIVPFSPWYEAQEIDEQTLEMAYRDYEELEKILQKLYREGASVYELYPKKEGLKILEERGVRKR